MPKIPLSSLPILLLAAVLIVLPVSAVQEKIVIYSSDFSKDPGFTTNNPSRYYWDVTNQQYHFETEGGTNGYAFIPVEIGNDPFTLEYDINISSINKDGALRFGLTSTDMDISKAANVLGIFDNGQYGMLMGLQVIDQNSHKYETNSLYSSYCGEQTDCETKLYKENVTYHVAIRYNNELRQADIKVTEKKSGGLAWGFYVTLGQELHSLSRLAITSKGDYILENNAAGSIDNVELYTYREVIPTVETTIPTSVPTTIQTTIPTPTPTESPQSLPFVFGALIIAAVLMVAFKK
ncbi:MAG: hypothetical protein LUQ33_04405 [Methanoregulaceae archaeon]|nr:hypothetical protein [Methanoregulaceae archaeon]